ncbi:MAG: serine/threonine protein kinase [Candidatus Riflebacteria bacterium]|nr:serine/threonine protein kinase [Candidatus Riflebacteria bacterium]
MEPDAPGVAAGPLEVGCRFGGCVVEGVLGSGANGWVYLGRQVSLQRPVAIKVLRSRGVESRARERFLQEGRLAGRLQHPGLVRIFDVGEQDELLYLVYELVEGGTLRDRFRDGPPIDAAVAVSIARSLAQALQAVHAAGVLHRDLKPENIFMSGRGPLLGDLGLAKDTMSSGIQTTQGFVVGTPAYLAPEVIQGEVYAPPADLYALGLVFFECLTGKFAFYDENPGNLLMLHICGQIPDPRSVREDLPGELTEFVRRALAKHPADRFADAGRFLEALSRLPGDEPAPASERPRPPHHGPTTKPVAVRQPRLRGPAAATRKGQPAPRAIRVLAAAGPRLMVAGACLALALAAAMLVWRAGGESREGPGSVAKPAPATDPTARVVHTTARRTVPSRDSVQLAARALAARTKDVRNRVSRLLSMRGSAGAPLTASEARQVVTAWLREAMDAAAKVLGTSLALAAAGDALGERQVALVLLDLFATYDACMGRLQDVVYAGPGWPPGCWR